MHSRLSTRIRTSRRLAMTLSPRRYMRLWSPALKSRDRFDRLGSRPSPRLAKTNTAPTASILPTVDKDAKEDRSDSTALATLPPLQQLTSQKSIVVARQFEHLNIFLGIEQANKYVLYDAKGGILGYIVEEDQSIGQTMMRQFARTHRSFTARVMDKEGNTLMKMTRPFTFINSIVSVYDGGDHLIGEVHQKWHLMRRKYELFHGKQQFADIDAPVLSWDFSLQNAQGQSTALITKNFTGFMQEMFTDAGQYGIQYPDDGGDIFNDEKKLINLACAIIIDYDYFSQHSRGPGVGFPFYIPFFGGGDTESNAPTPEGYNDAGTPLSTPSSPASSSTPLDNQGTAAGMGTGETNNSEFLSDDQVAGDDSSFFQGWGNEPTTNQGEEGSSWIDTMKDFFDDE